MATQATAALLEPATRELVRPQAVRICKPTALPVGLNAQFFIKANAVMAVVFLLVGAVGAVLLALTRWSAVHLLSDVWYYRILTLHGINMLIFWILFFEVAVLYFTCTSLLNARLFSKPIAWVALGMMVVGALMTNDIILVGKGDVLMTSYVPLKADPLFYVGMILVAVGTLIGIFIFFATLYIARRDEEYQKASHKVPGTLVLVFTLLLAFVVYYFANWKASTDVWFVR